MKKIFMVAVISSLLVGCKVDLETKINTDNLLSSEQNIVKGDINFEVSSCNDFEDSRKGSKSLIELKNKVPEIFRDAEYVECYKQKLNSFAHFSIPVGVGKVEDGQNTVDTDLMVFSYKEILAGVYASEGVIKRIKQAEKNSHQKMDFSISIILMPGNVKMDKVVALGVTFTGDTSKNDPVLISRIKFGNKPLTFKLSDVSVNQLMQYGMVPFLVTPEYFTLYK
ncbi:TPA: hypothetical protein ACNV0S_001153 [Proteus mirabilis]|uniref:DUF7424 family protein n=1 Tax=Proteus mirabilis TaxID=584 RepID=UPI0018C578C3|nr:hypothetical protein [Proteus mirabilis]MBG2783624.1 hypothetical protein [Proteus mirabilis]MBI6437910.1 hypothetical protein [Proteus mirabilis]MCZ4599273.1 hypothetical protein [Proteus mirabilis]MDF7256519.1 hypothetical protein [Proteus mirabilis]MDF7348510.1 hypothetical protein [Proteus mirabilis]